VKVSVVIPCYNAAPFVAETLESVLAQTHPDVEIVVVDDGSSDGSWEVVAPYADRILALRLERNRGGSHARNRGAELATGSFLMFLDADDVLEPDTLACLVAALGDTRDATAICRWVRLKERGDQWITVPSEVPLLDPAGDPLRQWLSGRWVPPCAVLWRRGVYDRTGGWDEDISYNDDGDLMLRSFVQGTRLVTAPCGRALYRFHGAERMSVGSDLSSERKLRSGVRVLNKVKAALDERGDRYPYRVPLGVAYRRLALYGFQNAHTSLAREMLRAGHDLAGRRAVSHSRLGRMVERMLGLERKERLAQYLAARGITTPGRALLLRRQRLLDAQKGTPHP
jgi:glycosyltransferase involved in cell wall biosynthesis